MGGLNTWINIMHLTTMDYLYKIAAIMKKKFGKWLIGENKARLKGKYLFAITATIKVDLVGNLHNNDDR